MGRKLTLGMIGAGTWGIGHHLPWFVAREDVEPLIVITGVAWAAPGTTATPASAHLRAPPARIASSTSIGSSSATPGRPGEPSP